MYKQPNVHVLLLLHHSIILLADYQHTHCVHWDYLHVLIGEHWDYLHVLLGVHCTLFYNDMIQ